MILKQKYCEKLLQFDITFFYYMDLKWRYVENNCASANCRTFLFFQDYFDENKVQKKRFVSKLKPFVTL